MSMKFNGTELSDVYFNGTQLDKVYFNGILIFEKSAGGFFRRMLLGEELKGATFKADFSNLVSWDNIKTRIPSNYSNNTLITVNNGDSVGITNASYEAFEENIPDYDEDFMDIPNTALYFIQFQGMNDTKQYLYTWNLTESADPTATPEISEGPVSGDPDASAIITTIKNNLDSTRCLFIQDPNIRPAQEGDVLRPGTMIHHNYLDSFPSAEMNYYPPMAQAHGINLANGEYQQFFNTSGNSSEEGVELIFNGIDETVSAMICSWKPGTNKVYSNQPSYILDPLDYNEEKDKFKIVSDGSFMVDNDAILVNTTTLVHEHDYGYKRRIMPGDNLCDLGTVYFDFPANYQPTEGGTFIELQNSNGGSYEFYEGDLYVDCCLDGETNFVFYEDQVNLSQLDLSSADGYVDWDCVVSEVDSDAPAYKHCYVKKPNLRPLVDGDYIGPGTTFYFNFPDDFHLRADQAGYTIGWTLDGGMEFVVMEKGAEDWYDESNIRDSLRIGITSAWDSTWGTIIYDGSSSSVTNLSSYTMPSQTWIEEFHLNGALNWGGSFGIECYKYILVDTNTLYRNIQAGDNIANQTIYNASAGAGYAVIEDDASCDILACSTSALQNTENFWLKFNKTTSANEIVATWSPYLNNIITYRLNNTTNGQTNGVKLYSYKGGEPTQYQFMRFVSPAPIYALNSMIPTAEVNDIHDQIYRYFLIRGEKAEPVEIPY